VATDAGRIVRSPVPILTLLAARVFHLVWTLSDDVTGDELTLSSFAVVMMLLAFELPLLLWVHFDGQSAEDGRGKQLESGDNRGRCFRGREWDLVALEVWRDNYTDKLSPPPPPPPFQRKWNPFSSNLGQKPLLAFRPNRGYRRI